MPRKQRQAKPLSDVDAVVQFDLTEIRAALRELRPYLDEARRGTREAQACIGEMVSDWAEAAAVVVQVSYDAKYQARAKRLLMVLGAALFELLEADADADEF